MAQEKDSMALTCNWLLKVHTSINSKLEKKQKLSDIRSLLEEGKDFHQFFKRKMHLKEGQESQDLYSQFNFIVQSIILYKTDLNNNDDAREEVSYLNKNIPLFLKRLKGYLNGNKRRF